jgi:hypothetical protein
MLFPLGLRHDLSMRLKMGPSRGFDCLKVRLHPLTGLMNV